MQGLQCASIFFFFHLDITYASFVCSVNAFPLETLALKIKLPWTYFSPPRSFSLRPWHLCLTIPRMPPPYQGRGPPTFLRSFCLFRAIFSLKTQECCTVESPPIAFLINYAPFPFHSTPHLHSSFFFPFPFLPPRAAVVPGIPALPSIEQSTLFSLSSLLPLVGHQPTFGRGISRSSLLFHSSSPSQMAVSLPLTFGHARSASLMIRSHCFHLSPFEYKQRVARCPPCERRAMPQVGGKFVV